MSAAIRSSQRGGVLRWGAVLRPRGVLRWGGVFRPRGVLRWGGVLRPRPTVTTIACVALLSTLHGAAAARKPVRHPVTMEAVAFQPADLTVGVGDTVIWTNKDPFPHTVKAKSGAFESKQVDADKTFTFRALKKGDYPYVCTLHPTMSGTLHVR
jgi:plastocyanin